MNSKWLYRIKKYDDVYKHACHVQVTGSSHGSLAGIADLTMDPSSTLNTPTSKN